MLVGSTSSSWELEDCCFSYGFSCLGTRGVLSYPILYK